MTYVQLQIEMNSSVNAFYGNNIKLENVAVANGLQLKAARCVVSCSRLFLANVVLGVLTNCYFTASNQNSGVAIRFNDPDFPKESNNLPTLMENGIGRQRRRWL